MIKIPKSVTHKILKNYPEYFGVMTDCGSFVGERQLIFVFEKNKTYLARNDEFIQRGFSIKLKKGVKRYE